MSVAEKQIEKVGRIVALGLMGVVLCHCGNAVTYNAERDRASLDIIERAWTLETEAGPLVLTLCSDLAAAEDTAEGDCDIDHVVRGDGSTVTRTEETGIGCGGCPFQTVAFVKGTLSGGDFGEEGQAVEGTVFMHSRHDDDPYALPYVLDLQLGDQTLTGTLNNAGILTIDNLPEGSQSGALAEFAPGEDAICP